MRDQPALRAHHIGMAVLADLDVGDHVPDQLQIDFGDGNAGVLAGAGQRQRHVGLGLAAEIDRPVIDLVGDGLGEFRILGEVEAAVDHVHRQPRDPQALVAGRIDLGQLGDGRHLAQQAQRVESPVIERSRRPRQLRGPAELALDLLDELADLGGGRLGLLALNADQRGLVLAIIEENLENPVGSQRNGDHRDEQRDIFGEQPAADFPPLRRRRRTPLPPQPKRPAHVLQAYPGGGKCSSGRNLARRPGLVSCRNAARLLDHLVGKCQQGRRNFEPGGLRRLKVEDKRIAGRLLERQIGRLGALEDAVDQRRRALEAIPSGPARRTSGRRPGPENRIRRSPGSSAQPRIRTHACGSDWSGHPPPSGWRRANRPT